MQDQSDMPRVTAEEFLVFWVPRTLLLLPHSILTTTA